MPWELQISLHCQVSAERLYSHYRALIKNWKKNILSALPACTVRSQQLTNSKLSSRVELCSLFLILWYLKAFREAWARAGTITSIRQTGKLRAATSVSPFSGAVTATKPNGPKAEETQASPELQAVREGGGRGWGGGRGRERLTIQSGLPVGSHSQEGLGEDPGQKQKKRASGAAWSPGPRPSTGPRSRPAPPQTARKQTYFLPPAGPPAPPAVPGPRHSRRGML